MRILVKISGISDVISGDKNLSYQCKEVDSSFSSDCENIWVHPMEQLIFDPDDNTSEYEGEEVIDVSLVDDDKLKQKFLKQLEQTLNKGYSTTQLSNNNLGQIANQVSQDLFNFKRFQSTQTSTAIAVKIGISHEFSSKKEQGTFIEECSKPSEYRMLKK